MSTSNAWAEFAASFSRTRSAHLEHEQAKMQASAPSAGSPAVALGRKVSDEFVVPLCRGHNREVHRHGDETAWWKKAGINPIPQARALWLETHPISIGPNNLLVPKHV
jgi:hypothetical protein